MPSVYVNTAASGDTTLVAAPGAGKFIRLLGYSLTGFGDVLAIFKSAGVNLTAVRIKDGGGAVLEPFDNWQLDLDANAALVMNLSGAIQVVGHITYKIVG